MNVSQEEISLFSSNIQSYGIDEAGRGPYAGPLSVALVSYSWETLQKVAKDSILRELNDSKKISEKQREDLYPEILKFAEIVRHTFISSKLIDKCGISYSFLYAVQKLTQSLPILPQTLFLIDGKYSLKNFAFSNPNLKNKIQFIIKGDTKFVNIASASIIAKVKRDRLMKSYGKKISSLSI